MHFRILTILMFFSVLAAAQKESTTLLDKCPVFITDTLSPNNFFLEFQPATVKVYRAKGVLTITIEQKDQFFTLLFNRNKLKNTKYKIQSFANSKNELAAKYSFKSGDQVSYVNMTSGTVETKFNKESSLWQIKVNGLLSNYVGQSVTYFRVKAEFSIL